MRHTFTAIHGVLLQGHDMQRVVWFVAPLALIGIVMAAFFAADIRPKERVLTFDGLGPVRIGMTVTEAEAALGKKLAPLDPSNQMDTEACWTTGPADDSDRGVSYMLWDGKIVRIDIFPSRREGERDVIPSVVTEKNIRLTTPVDDVKKAYGRDLAINFHIQGDVGNYDFLYMTTLSTDKRHGLFFETWDNKLASFGAATNAALHLQEGCF